MAADVGIALGTIGTAVAMETADVVLLTDKVWADLQNAFGVFLKS